MWEFCNEVRNCYEWLCEAQWIRGERKKKKYMSSYK